MFLKKERFLNYLFSLFLLTIFINTIPIPQLPKYILFILINFAFFTFPNKKIFYKNKNLFFYLIIFFLIIIFITIAPIKFAVKVNSFGNTDPKSMSFSANEFYQVNFPLCYQSNLNLP